MQQKLHIVCFDNPYPARYGGVIDVFYKIKALHESGIGITLHCFTAEKSRASKELTKITDQVYFYRKNRNPFYLLSKTPFATRSRSSEKLAKNLLADDVPILFEGLQSSFLATDPRFDGRKKYLRLHNIESRYYAGMAASEPNWFMKKLYQSEARKFEYYQQFMIMFDKVFTLSLSEQHYVQENFGNGVYVPVFNGNEPDDFMTPFGSCALYHGDLRLPDNRKAVEFLIDVFRDISGYELIIASASGRDFVHRLIKKVPNVRHMNVSSQFELNVLLREAHISVMVSFQESGTKLKLINSLYKSRHCLINANIVDDPRIRDLCVLATDVESFRQKINMLRETPFNDIERRVERLIQVYFDKRNAYEMREIIYNSNQYNQAAPIR